jgi:hypothetical protein
MANKDNMGIKPADKIPSQEMIFNVTAAGNATNNMFVGDVVICHSGGGVIVSTGGTNPEYTVGVVVALYDSNGIPVGAPGSSVSTKYLPVSTAGKALVALALPGRRFIGQCAFAYAAADADIFATADISNTAGDTTTATSKHELLGSALNTEGQCLILGRVGTPDNAVGADADVYFCFNESMFAPNGKAVGV